MRKGDTATSTSRKRRSDERTANRTKDDVPLVAGPEWNDPEYGDAARERSPIYRQMHGLPPLSGDEPVEPEVPERRVTLRLDADLVDFYRAEAERLGAGRLQAAMELVLRAWARERQSKAAERRAAE